MNRRQWRHLLTSLPPPADQTIREKRKKRKKEETNLPVKITRGFRGNFRLISPLNRRLLVFSPADLSRPGIVPEIHLEIQFPIGAILQSVRNS